MLTEEHRRQLVIKLENEEKARAEKQYKEEESKPIKLNQNQEDVNLFIRMVQDHDGIVEYNLKNILNFSSERRYLRARRDALSFCMGSITMDRKTRRFYNHAPELSQEKLI